RADEPAVETEVAAQDGRGARRRTGALRAFFCADALRDLQTGPGGGRRADGADGGPEGGGRQRADADDGAPDVPGAGGIHAGEGAVRLGSVPEIPDKIGRAHV